MALLTVLVPSAAELHAGSQVVLSAAKDNTLYETDQGQFTNGAGDHIFSGKNLANEARRAVIAFDLSPIPTGSIITGVSLELYMSRTQAGTETVEIHSLLTDWGEEGSDADGNEGVGDTPEPGDATWLHTFFDDQFWAQLGGDFVNTASAGTQVGGIGYYTWSSNGMINDVQGWVNNPSSNFGWIVIGNEAGVGTAKRFDSRTHPFSNRRPQLTINFTVVDSNGACCFDDGICEILMDTDCVAQGGDYQGDGQLCTPNPCPQPTGSCCRPDLTCTIENQPDCLAVNGIYNGNDTDCDSGLCEAITGACCFGDASCALLSVSNCDSQGGTYQGYGEICTAGLCPLTLTPYLDPLPLPATATPVVGQVGGVATYDIAMRQFTQQLHSELPPTTVWGYGEGPTGGTYPGPTIEATADQQVSVIWRNDIRDAQGALRTDHYLDVDLCPHGAEDSAKSVVHLHGGHTFEEYDGYPEDTYEPGFAETYEYPNKQLPATLWYHDHALGQTRLNVYMGLAGFYLIRDAFENSLNLPSGEFEVPLLLQDRTFNPDGTFFYPSTWQDHFFGDFNLVNGKVWPFFEVKQGKYRFRILNGANSRTYTLTLSNGAPFTLIGTDGGLLPEPVVMSEITLTSAERMDVIVDFAGIPAGTEILLTNSAPAPYPGTPGVGVVSEVMKFIVTSDVGDTNPIPTNLRPIEKLDEADAVIERDFELAPKSDPCNGNAWLINELMWETVTEFPVLGTTEVWRFINPSGISHPMHLHLVSFQILDIQEFVMMDGEVTPIGSPQPPPPHLAGWKDTVEVEPDQIVRVIARFEDYLGLFAYHCHILEHEDHEMMRQFRTVECNSNLDCSDGQFCNGNEQCNPITFTCEPGPPIDCSDLFACTDDFCDPTADDGAGACVNVENDSLCDNGDYCDGQESCSFLTGCVNGVPPCAPELTCDEGIDACTGCDNDEICADSNLCTNETCDSGQCISQDAFNVVTECCDPETGIIMPISDGDPCTDDECDPAAGVVTHTTDDSLCAAGFGCRYLRVTPGGDPATPVAILVTDSNQTCFQKYAQADGSLGDLPLFQTPGSWGTVDLFDEALVPARSYEVSLEDANDIIVSRLATTWNLGDVDDNGTANFADVQQIVLMFQQLTPPTPAGDIKPCLPNAITNFEDILAGVQGFQGLTYTETACVDPCP
ncbi:MAG: multicopper oxidase domain-containing protein [Phycisphaerae bacterium]